MSKKRRNRHETAAAHTAPNRRGWVVAGVASALVFAGLVGWQSWRPVNPQQEFELALAAYPDDLDEVERRLDNAFKAVEAPYPNANALLACAFARRRDWNEVERRIVEFDLNETRPDLLAELGELAVTHNQLELATRVLTLLANRDCPQQAPSLVQLIALHQTMGREVEALDCAARLTRVEPSDARWWWLLADLYRQQGDEVQEVATFQLALKQPITDNDARAMRHKLFERLVLLGDAAAARLELGQLDATANPADHQERVRLDVNHARLLRLEGHPREALSFLDRAMPALGDVPMAVGLRGTLLMDLGEFQPAIQELSRALVGLPYDEVLHYKLAESYRRSGQTEKSTHHLAAYQKIHTARLEIGRLEAASHDRPLTATQQSRLAKLRAQVGEGEEGSR